MNSLDKIAKLIQQSTGLDADCYGAKLFDKVVQERFRVSGLATLEEFCRRLGQSKSVRRDLIEALVVPETWFFRGRESFAALTQWVRAEWLPVHANETLRLLSAPCSTGEEPYSLAMTLLDTGLAASKFHIDAVDISERAIATARQGMYRKNSFREKQPGLRERYFRAVDGNDLLHEAVRRTVNFQVGNLAGEDFPAPVLPYHIIFCRNLLIYFDRATQKRVIETCAEWLVPGGLLFVGHAETNTLAEHGFAPLKHPQAFGFRRREKKKSNPAPTWVTITANDLARQDLQSPKPKAGGRNRLPASVVGPLARNDSPSGAPMASPTGDGAARENFSANLTRHQTEDPLLEVQRLADQGRLAEAAALCQAQVREQGVNANAYYWLGVVHDAAGEPESASECYRKAIYLQPEHTEALWHLALLVEKNGDDKQARGWRRRAQRATERSRA